MKHQCDVCKQMRAKVTAVEGHLECTACRRGRKAAGNVFMDRDKRQAEFPFVEDIQELKAIYVKFGETQSTDYYERDDVFSWYDGVTHVSREVWNEYQRLLKEVRTIEAQLFTGIRYYSAEEGTRP